MPVHPVTLAVGHPGIGHGLSQAQVERADHAVGSMKPAEGLKHDLVHRAAGFAVYWRPGDAFAGQSEATGQQHRHRGAIMQPEYHRVLGDPVYLEERSNRAEQIDHLEHQRHVKWKMSRRRKNSTFSLCSSLVLPVFCFCLNLAQVGHPTITFLDLRFVLELVPCSVLALGLFRHFNWIWGLNYSNFL